MCISLRGKGILFFFSFFSFFSIFPFFFPFFFLPIVLLSQLLEYKRQPISDKFVVSLAQITCSGLALYKESSLRYIYTYMYNAHRLVVLIM